jgi:glycosyltransferase involved in cell wall biosynthesis
VLGIGRLIPRKGFDTLLRATAIAKDRASAPFTVDIIGEGPEREALGALAEELGVASLVRFVGAVPYDTLPEHYASADVYVLASHAEGMPLVVLEAMATGLPIVATDVQGVAELVADGENGRRFPVEDAAALAERLAELIADAEKRAEYGAASRRRVEKYDWTNIADAYLDLLERAAAERDDA